jgi:hypothetical protein
MMQTPGSPSTVQTVRTQAVGDVEIEIELDPDVDDEIEAILEGLTEHVPEEPRRTDRYRCVPARRR